SRPMGGSDGLSGVDEQAKTRAERYGIEPALAFRPFHQVQSAVFAFGIERRRIEIPLEQTYEIGPIAERVFEQSRKSYFPSQTSETESIRSEFKYACFAGPRIFGEPRITRRVAVEVAYQLPLVAPGHGVTGLESKIANRGRGGSS